MKSLIEEISDVSALYFSREELKPIFNFLDLYKDNIKTEFYQIIQSSENIPKLEIGCLINDSLLDITYSKDSLLKTIFRFKAVEYIKIDETPNYIQLQIHSSAPLGLVYQAVNEKYQKTLRRYGEYLSNLMVRGGI